MDVKEAVQLAKKYIRDLFAEERAENIGLEEVEYDGATSTWRVTIGLSRPWDREEWSPIASIGEMLTTPRKLRRDMKVVVIEDSTGVVSSVKNRE